jgi:hypothetical protein
MAAVLFVEEEKVSGPGAGRLAASGTPRLQPNDLPRQRF